MSCTDGAAAHVAEIDVLVNGMTFPWLQGLLFSGGCVFVMVTPLRFCVLDFVWPVDMGSVGLRHSASDFGFPGDTSSLAEGLPG